MPVKIFSGEAIQSRRLIDGELQIRKHKSDWANPGKTVYTMFHIGELTSVQFSGRYFECLTLEQYRKYFNRIKDRDDLIKFSRKYEQEYELMMDNLTRHSRRFRPRLNFEIN